MSGVGEEGKNWRREGGGGDKKKVEVGKVQTTVSTQMPSSDKTEA